MKVRHWNDLLLDLVVCKWFAFSHENFSCFVLFEALFHKNAQCLQRCLRGGHRWSELWWKQGRAVLQTVLVAAMLWLMLLHYPFCRLYFFIVRPEMSICLLSRPWHLAAGGFRSWRAVRNASVLSAPCESQCGGIRRISGGESCSFERRRSADQHRAPQQALGWAVCVLTCVSLNVSLGDRCEGWRGKSTICWEDWQQFDVLLQHLCFLFIRPFFALRLLTIPSNWQIFSTKTTHFMISQYPRPFSPNNHSFRVLRQ